MEKKTVLEVDGVVTIDGFLKSGSDAPSIKMKKYTGTTGSTEGANVYVAHGLTTTKILSVEVLVYFGATDMVPPNFTTYIGRQFHFRVIDWAIEVFNHPTNSELILSKPFTVLITYEE